MCRVTGRICMRLLRMESNLLHDILPPHNGKCFVTLVSVVLHCNW